MENEGEEKNKLQSFTDLRVWQEAHNEKPKTAFRRFGSTNVVQDSGLSPC